MEKKDTKQQKLTDFFKQPLQAAATASDVSSNDVEPPRPHVQPPAPACEMEIKQPVNLQLLTKPNQPSSSYKNWQCIY